jgi:hypothetical protein
VISKAFRASFRWRFYPLAAPAEKMGAVSAGALSRRLCLSLVSFVLESHRLIASKDILGLTVYGALLPDHLRYTFDSLVCGAARGSSWLRRITLSAVRVSTDGAIKEWLCQPRFRALPSPERVLGNAREINPRTSAVMFGNKELAR